MLKRNLFYLLVVTVLAASIPCLAADESLVYTGDLFAPFAQSYFCAQASDTDGGVPDVPVLFQGTTIWGRTLSAGPVTTNSIGRICTKANWPSDIYEMYVLGSGPFDGIVSPPVAVTIFPPDWAGVFAGGAICIAERLAAPNGCGVVPCREATYGVFIRTIEQKSPAAVVGEHPKLSFCGRPARLLYLDPFAPMGAVRISAQNFMTDLFFIKQTLVRIPVPTQGAIVRMYGYCWFQQGDAEPIWARFDAELDVNAFPAVVGSPADGGVIQSANPFFSIRVWKYPYTMLYQAGGNTRDGGAYLKCTGGHNPPP